MTQSLGSAGIITCVIWPYNSDETLQIVRSIATEVFGAGNAGEPAFLANGSNNAAFVVQTKGRKTVIRVTGDWRQQSTIQERWCYEQAKQLGIPGPEVLAIGKVEKLPYLVMTFVEGVPGTEPSVPSDGMWRTLGHYANLINSVEIGKGSVMSEGKEVFPDPAEQWQGWLDECDRAHEDIRLVEAGAFTSEQRPAIATVLSAMRHKSHQYGLSHGDLDPRNVIVGPDGAINLIDWCCSLVSLIPHVDLYNILRETDTAGPEIRAYLDGYGLPYDEYLSLLPEVHAYGIIQKLKRLGWSINERSDLVPGDVEDLRESKDRHLAMTVQALATPGSGVASS